jgi:hypothetical protein
LQSLTPEEKWKAIRQAFYAARVLPLSYAAFDLAQQYLHQARPAEELRREAQSIDAKLEALLAEMKAQDPEIPEALGALISETVMDCSYVIHDLDVVSLRLKHVIESERYSDQEQPTSKSCPNCGTANPIGSRFCNQCGQPLAG